MAELESVDLFCHLNQDELLGLKRIVQERSVKAGAPIFQEGEPGDGVYVVKQGLVEIVHVNGAEERRVFSQLGTGEIFGEMAVIELQPRSASALAAKDTDLYFIPRDEIRALLQQSPGLAFTLLTEISRRLREFNQRHLREMVQSESLAVIGRFAQSIVHDLKNPLSIIGLSAEIFEMPNISPEIRARTQSRIRRQIDRISDMVSDILIFTGNQRSDAGLKTVDYRAFVLELIPELQAETAIKAAQIEMPAAPPSVTVVIDPRRLGRVFYNLIHNATDVMREGGKIFLRFQLTETEIITEIEDTGPGIAPEIADTLFQPFATFGKTHGTGLGLSISKKIIEDHHGCIWADSKTGRGAIFSFALPKAKA